MMMAVNPFLTSSPDRIVFENAKSQSPPPTRPRKESAKVLF
jgi:hypothetical protein